MTHTLLPHNDLTQLGYTKPASVKALDFLDSLLGKKAHAYTAADRAAAAQDSKQCSQMIDALKVAPWASKKATTAPKAQAPKVLDGKYALVIEGVVKFYRVDSPTQGKWAGYTFVKVFASDTEYPVKGAAAHAVLTRIAEDPKAASALYGEKTMHCGVCSKKLTDPESLARGIGPICADKF